MKCVRSIMSVLIWFGTSLSLRSSHVVRAFVSPRLGRQQQRFSAKMNSQAFSALKSASSVAAGVDKKAPSVSGSSVSATSTRANSYSAAVGDAGSSVATTDTRLINLSTTTQQELETVVTAWGYPKYRAEQIWNWIRVQGVTNVPDMVNLPKKLRQQLQEFAKPAALELVFEMISKDGTIKRAYRCFDGQVIESVLMPYQDGRYTACISSQAGCAQGCVFCATGQMSFARQLSSDEIFEQVARFAAELQQQEHKPLDHDDSANKQQETTSRFKSSRKEKQKLPSSQQNGRSKRLSNVVFMGMGEPLANTRNVFSAINRITQDLGIGARKITVSTVGIVPNIRKLYTDPTMPQVRLAVSLHCASDEERTALIPANKRYGGLPELMTTLREYIDTTGRRVTLEWALIEGENDGPETARKLGKLITTYKLRRDMVHVNVIPLNPTGGFRGSPSSRGRVDTFVKTLEEEFGIACTPRVRRGIDIEAGCGQLKAKVLEKEGRPIAPDASALNKKPLSAQSATVGVYEDDEEDDTSLLNQCLAEDAVDFESDDYDDPVFETDADKAEAAQLIERIKGTIVAVHAGRPETERRQTP